MAEQKNEQAQDINQLLKIRRDKLKELQENGKDPFTITKYDVTHHSQEIKDQFDELEGQEVSIAGRLMSKRVRIYREIFSPMWHGTVSGKMPTKISRKWISVIS